MDIYIAKYMNNIFYITVYFREDFIKNISYCQMIVIMIINS